MYVKLFSSILTSSVWSEDMPTRIVWITLLAMADKDGDVRASPSGLARIANVPPEDCRRALAKFLAPDPESGTPDDDGRRIEEREAGWWIINYAKYRHMIDEETRKAQWRESSRRHRVSKRQQKSAARQHESAHTDTDTDTITTSFAKPAKTTWLTPYLDEWERTYGVGSGATLNGQMAKAFGPLHKAHGTAEVVRRLRHYLGATEARFASPTQFAQKFAGWDVPAPAVGNRLTRGREALAETLRRHEAPDGKPTGNREVPCLVPRVVPDARPLLGDGRSMGGRTR